DGCNKDIYKYLERNLSHQMESIGNVMMETYRTFEKCLQKGVEMSKTSYERILKTSLYPPRRNGAGFCKQLKKVVQNGGIYKPNRGKEINLNMKLTSFMTDSIDEDFRKTFPNDGKCGPFNGVISKFSVDTEGLRQKHGDVELQLIFLKSEEEQIKTKLTQLIRNRKKNIYKSLMTKAEEIMQACYDKAAGFSGTGLLQNMRNTIERHVHESKDTMFERAKYVMLGQLLSLMMDILEKLENTMKESIELSLKTDGTSIPDVSTELTMVQNLHDELLKSS
ncbi:hypothetical protein GOODEAATRI_021371, partial [Goodea atripinnis]